MARRLLLAGALGAMATTGTGGALARGLDALLWEYRPLLIFTPSETDARLSRQTTILADGGRGLEERKLAVLIVSPKRVFVTYGAPAPGAEARALRRRYHVADDAFRVVLIGLDGGEKFAADHPIALEALYATIDGMPMRRRELRERGVD